MVDERERDVRRPWLPGCLRRHGLDVRSVGDLAYIVIDEIIDEVVGLIVWAWPAADGAGRLRFDRAESALEVGVSLRRLHDELYAGRLEREPRVGDVFGARLSEEARARLAGGQGVWDAPLRELLGEVVYDLSREARLVAKLAFFSTMGTVVDRETSEAWRLTEVADIDEEPAPLLHVGPAPEDDRAG